MIEPNCDMPWEIYLDWLQDQGNEDLRAIDVHSLVTGQIIHATILPNVYSVYSGCPAVNPVVNVGNGNVGSFIIDANKGCPPLFNEIWRGDSSVSGRGSQCGFGFTSIATYPPV